MVPQRRNRAEGPMERTQDVYLSSADGQADESNEQLAETALAVEAADKQFTSESVTARRAEMR